MTAPTRRGLIGGAIATAAAPALTRARAVAGPGSIAARAKTVRRGRSIAYAARTGRLVVAHDAERTIAIVSRGRRRVVDVGGQPLEIAISPDGRTAVLTTAYWDVPGLAIVDLLKGRLAGRVDAGEAPFGAAFTADGRRLVVGGGEQDGTLHIFEPTRMRVVERRPVGAYPRSIAADPRGDGVWVSLNGPDRVVLINARNGRSKRAISTPPLPDRIAVSPDGGRLLVCHGGLEAERVSEIDVSSRRLRRIRAGRLPSGVGWARGGTRLIALGGAGAVVAISPTGRRTRHEVGAAPRGLAVAGRRAWTVDALDGRIARVRI